MIPQRHLKVGDVVRCEIDKLGATENKVVASKAERFPELEPDKIAKVLATADT
jgi:hypothetical protein